MKRIDSYPYQSIFSIISLYLHLKSLDGLGQWWGALLITGAVVAVVSAGAIFGMKKYKERMEGVNRFNELKKSQMRGRAESDDDEYDSDPYEDEVARNNRRSAPPPPAQQPQP